MTHNHGRRAGDHVVGWRARLMKWHADWEQVFQLVVGCVAIISALGLLILAALFYGAENDRNKRNAKAAGQAREQCVRTRLIGPPLADAYEKYRILTPEQIKVVRATIPEHC